MIPHVKVLDSLPGTGKTTAIFNMMKNIPENKYLYVTPMLSEVDRIKSELPELNFQAPTTLCKSEDVLRLLLDGNNIACTHSLFQIMTEDRWKVIEEQSYHLILDEEVNCVESFNKGKRGDVPHMVKMGLAEIEGPFSRVSLKVPLSTLDNTGLEPTATAAAKGTLYTSKNATQRDFLVTHIPIELFKAAKSTTIVTYLYSGSVLERFLSLHGFGYCYIDVELYKTNEEVISSLKELINITTTRKINELSRKSLSVTGYQKGDADFRKAIGEAVRSVARDVPDSRLIITMPKDNATKGKNYVGLPRFRPLAGSWLWSGTRATNEYADKNTIIHLYDRYPNASVSAYFQSHGLPICADHFALSEMIQFVFRSAVRKGKPIDLYVASPRMKKIFVDWMNQEEEEELLEAV